MNCKTKKRLLEKTFLYKPKRFRLNYVEVKIKDIQEEKERIILEGDGYKIILLLFQFKKDLQEGIKIKIKTNDTGATRAI